MPRTRGTAPAPQASGQDLNTLTRALASLSPRDKFKAPVFKGEGDVEYYIKQFKAVRTANGWDGASAVIHLRSSLEGPALDCGQGGSVAEINQALRARFGLTVRQARDKLTNLKRLPKHSLHEHATEVRRLVEKAFLTLDAEDREGLALDYFIRSLDNRALQRHMLAMDPDSLAEAVQAAEEFLQVGGFDRAARMNAMVVDDAPSGRDMATVEASLAAITKVLEAQSTLLSKLVTRVDQLDGATNGGEGSQRRRATGCYICQGPHLKKDCPRRAGVQAKVADSDQGNAAGPGQE